MWSTVLGVPAVGADGGFFELGGDSIRALRAVGLLRQAGVEVAVRDLFRQQSPAALAAYLTAAKAGPPDALGSPGGTGEEAGVAPFALVSAADRAALPDGVTDAYPLSMGRRPASRGSSKTKGCRCTSATSWACGRSPLSCWSGPARAGRTPHPAAPDTPPATGRWSGSSRPAPAAEAAAGPNLPVTHLAGSHLGVLTPPHVRLLADQLTAWLDEGKSTGKVQGFDGTAKRLHGACERYDEASKRFAVASKRFDGTS